MKGVISSIQRFSIQDGPGIRTTLFFKGCPLRCTWCSNPETQEPHPQLSLVDDGCFNQECSKCVLACKDQAIIKTELGIWIDTKRCSLCGECIKQCPESNIKIVGKEFTVDELIAEVLKDQIFYHHSDGGITLSGGEPLLQSEFCYRLLQRCKEFNLHTVLDTSAGVPWEVIAATDTYTNLFYVDLKHVDDRVHRKYVGVSNQQVLKNIKRMANEICGEKVVIRIPLVTKMNRDRESIKKIASFIKSLNVIWPVHLLPYHRMGERKYRLIGRNYTMADILPPTKEEIGEAVESYRHFHIEVEVVS